MNNTEYLQLLINDHLGGAKNRIGELFEDEVVYRQLQAQSKESDWYHFEPKTFDGSYLVRGNTGYEVYEQDRGSRSNLRTFDKLSDAAVYFFNSN